MEICGELTDARGDCIELVGDCMGVIMGEKKLADEKDCPVIGDDMEHVAFPWILEDALFA